ncbi:hypothetical protein HC256_006659 [Beauveria bassiana]|nr:hypothetical protein HC256_006659 [Beauveria bassiana]
MSQAVDAVQLTETERQQLESLLHHIEQHPTGWIPKADYEGMDEYFHKDVRHLIEPLIGKGMKHILIRITGDPRNYKYFFDVGDLIPIAGESYSISDGKESIRLALGDRGHLSRKITVQVADGSILYLLWLVKAK